MMGQDLQPSNRTSGMCYSSCTTVHKCKMQHLIAGYFPWMTDAHAKMT